MENERRLEILGILTIALSVFISVSLIGYNTSEEPSISSNVQVTNPMGILGIFTSHLFIKLGFGFSTIVIPLLGFAWGWFLFSKKELTEIKEQIIRYKDELESARTKVNNSPDAKKMKEEGEKLEREIAEKRKELESGFRELKFIKDEMAKSSKNEGSDKIVDAASSVVASMNQKLQTTMTELKAVKEALENERAKRNKTS